MFYCFSFIAVPTTNGYAYAFFGIILIIIIKSSNCDDFIYCNLKLGNNTFCENFLKNGENILVFLTVYINIKSCTENVKKFIFLKLNRI